MRSRPSSDVLDVNWQRLILTHLEEKEHLGVLTGSAITDMKITLIAGKAHQKHTEGGDFRQATYRAVRQGLKKAQSILLEPYYTFRLEVPMENVGRAMADIQRMNGRFDPPVKEGDMSVLSGSAPVAAMRGYQTEAYTDAQKAMEVLCGGEGSWQFLIVDDTMPKYRGTVLARKAKQRSGLKVILLTGLVGQDTVLMKEQGIVDEFLLKPVRFKELLDTMERMTKQREGRENGWEGLCEEEKDYGCGSHGGVSDELHCERDGNNGNQRLPEGGGGDDCPGRPGKRL